MLVVIEAIHFVFKRVVVTHFLPRLSSTPMFVARVLGVLYPWYIYQYSVSEPIPKDLQYLPLIVLLATGGGFFLTIDFESVFT